MQTPTETRELRDPESPLAVLATKIADTDRTITELEAKLKQHKEDRARFQKAYDVRVQLIGTESR